MSQAGKVIINPVGPGDTTGLIGNDGLVVVPDGSGHIHVIGDGVTLTTSRVGGPGSSTLNIALENTISNTATTTDGAFHDIIEYAMNGDGEAVTVSGLVIGTRKQIPAGTQYTAVCGGAFSFVARYVSGSGLAVLLNDSINPQAQDAATPPAAIAAYQLIPSTNNIILQVKGINTQRWDWKAIINFVKVEGLT